MNDNGKSTSDGDAKNRGKETIPTRPLTLELKLLNKTQHVGTDITSFRFSRGSNDMGEQQHPEKKERQNYYLDYMAGQYAIVDLGTKEDPEGPIRSFTLASSPTEKDFILTVQE